MAQGAQGKTPVEHRLLSALKPKEHGGWDCKSCASCRKNIELLATVCQHCGHEQESPLAN
jgi:predicted amidophosphoribosyltransferase